MASATALGKRRANFPSDPLGHPLARSSASFLSSRLTSFEHSTPLLAHHSCVNALAFSNGDGKWLASGGDDKRVLLWNSFGRLSGAEPVAVYRGARSNIFSIAFSCDNTKVFSGGNDETILMHDLETSASASSKVSTSGAPTDIWMDHDAPVRDVCCHPTNPNLFLSASEDGSILQFDLRTGGVTGCLNEASEFNSVAYHPLTPENFASSDAQGRLLLHDARMAFSDGGGLASEVAVVHYATVLTRPDQVCASKDPGSTMDRWRSENPDTSSIVFDPSGKMLVGTISKHLPTLYELSDPLPLATFSSPKPNPHEGYSNACTIKNGSFGGTPDNLFYAGGSDDFRAYVWSVPNLELLRTRRLSPRSPSIREDWFDPSGSCSIGYESSSDPSLGPIIPFPISTPSVTISAHRSIVNTALFHPSLPLLFTSGIEKMVFAHSATPFDATPSTPFVPRERNGGDARSLFVAAMREVVCSTEVPEGEGEGEKEIRLRGEDGGVLEYFDAILEKEGRRGGVFEREVGEESDTESEESEESSDGEGEGEEDSDSGLDPDDFQ